MSVTERIVVSSKWADNVLNRVEKDILIDSYRDEDNYLYLLVERENFANVQTIIREEGFKYLFPENWKERLRKRTLTFTLEFNAGPEFSFEDGELIDESDETFAISLLKSALPYLGGDFVKAELDGILLLSKETYEQIHK